MRVIEAFDFALFALKLQKDTKPIGRLQTYHEEFVRHIQFQQNMFDKLAQIQKGRE
jgi:hypothetical protein